MVKVKGEATVELRITFPLEMEVHDTTSVNQVGNEVNRFAGEMVRKAMATTPATKTEERVIAVKIEF